MAQEAFESVYRYKLIYVFRIDDAAHAGLLKIGDATLKSDAAPDALPPDCPALRAAAEKRIAAYTNTAGITAHLLHTELAVRLAQTKESTAALVPFRDYDVHAVLEHSGIHSEKVGTTTGREWYRVDLATAKQAIAAVKQGRANLGTEQAQGALPIVLRPEQEACVAQVVRHFRGADRFLINAKMRFGKTFVALTVIKRCAFRRSLILTHRPVVHAGWYEDFTKLFAGTDYRYGSKESGYRVEELLHGAAPFVYFASIQDLRGSRQVGGSYEKNAALFGAVWDCVIVDEAHEGTQTALGEKTVRAVVKAELGKTKFLALSGTPFNILSQYEKDGVFTWDYIMEQEAKARWAGEHFGDSNPYAGQPQLAIYTYDLGSILKNPSFRGEDHAFNFREFFRTWTGEPMRDFGLLPTGAAVGDFVYAAEVKHFLTLLTQEEGYPFSSQKYRALFHHTLWILPGVREARALERLLKAHPVFGFMRIVNVAGEDEEEREDALSRVRTAIREAGADGYTATLSCGRLTTGVTVPEWTAVLMLAGSAATSAAHYLQTIFRVQSAGSRAGQVKERAYVFDFAPDRTLKMVACAVAVSGRPGHTGADDRRVLGKFLNFCPVIAVAGSTMRAYSTARLLQQLKRAYAEHVVASGFDDPHLYNDNLLKLDRVDLRAFERLKGIIGRSRATAGVRDITINQQGLTNEEYEERERLAKKKKQSLTSAEKKRLAELRALKKQRADAISLLRAISIRMPLLLYGADVPESEDITLSDFVALVDDESWREFMPRGVTKKLFARFQKYYDEDVFLRAGQEIRRRAQDADRLRPIARAQKIAALFQRFKNPDKETVLTPWRVVNLHLGTTIGGWDFFDESHREALAAPRYVEIPGVTREIFGREDTRLLEINAKSGLYPLYLACSLFLTQRKKYRGGFTKSEERALWRDIVARQIFVVCSTPMAKQITRRTLLGSIGGTLQAHDFQHLAATLASRPQSFVRQVTSGRCWGREGKMKFDAIVGNPPYMQMDGGARASARPIYQYFIEAAKRLAPRYASFIIPTRWYAGGKGLDDFRDAMLSDPHLSVLHDCLTPEDIFPGTNIRGGVCWFLLDSSYDNRKDEVEVVTHEDGRVTDDVRRPLRTSGTDIFIRDSHAVRILAKVAAQSKDFLSAHVSTRKPFGIEGKIVGEETYHEKPDGLKDPVKCYSKGRSFGFVERAKIPNHADWVDVWKVFTPRANNVGTELADDNLNAFLGAPGTICTESYLVIGADLGMEEESAAHIAKYFRTKFARYLHSVAKASQDATAKTYQYVPMPDFTAGSDLDWSADVPALDRALYAKYGLSEEESRYIEQRIKPMA